MKSGLDNNRIAKSLERVLVLIEQTVSNGDVGRNDAAGDRLIECYGKRERIGTRIRKLNEFADSRRDGLPGAAVTALGDVEREIELTIGQALRQAGIRDNRRNRVSEPA
jgi:hypothetical protein